MPNTGNPSVSESSIDHRDSSDSMSNDKLRIIMQTIGTYGVPAVLIVMFYVQIFKPDQDARRELERINSNTLIQLGNSMQMLVDQDRRREMSTQDVLRIQQEQTRILQQIMIDQKRGAWNDKDVYPPGSHAVIKPEQ